MYLVHFSYAFSIIMIPTPIQQVAPYLNEKVHDLSSNMAKYDEAPSESCGFQLEEFVSCISPDLLEMMDVLTLSKY